MLWKASAPRAALTADLDQLERAITDRLLEPPRRQRDRLAQEHEIAGFLDRVQQQSAFLLETYRDKDGLRAREMKGLLGGEIGAFEEFYKQLNEVKDLHRKYPNGAVDDLEEAYRKKPRTEEAMDEIDRMFTGEETQGRYMDLIRFHEEYLNLRGAKHLTYLQYLNAFFRFDAVPKTSKDDAYVRYLDELAEYLQSFLRRTQPLSDPDGIIAKIGEDFADEWQREEAARADDDALFCKPCGKAFEKETVFQAHLDSKKHKRTAAAGGAGAGGSAAAARRQAVARGEYVVEKLAEVLDDVRAETLANVERRQTLTDRERQLELDALDREELSAEEEEEEDEAVPEDDGKIYNPLKLPLGWDGKPIPFWLWKLHGLGVEYPCEICGNFVYMGRKAFDKHFMEARHVHGLRCLGITNSHVFREIIYIKDAIALWTKLKKDKRLQENSREQIVEMEDDEGNVMSEKIYNDLKKQGLL
ncbi:uncharacterized protein V1510DRAFT_447405 [Dipodascopsis tothii]|uniref:uncharacterized protein n=1 Tax=Dipodascopsis tothii TaxID=44089 RepID=UPI0034CFDF3F